ncbi:LemA family protein [bacterium]|nr:LemA family protein [bacterium]
MNNILWIGLGLAVVFAVMYNSLINKKNQVENAFGGMDAQLKKRYDLIPNLVKSVKGYMEHEAKTLTEITTLRTKALSSNISDDDKVALDNALTSKLGGIMVAVENYPDLKASENFNQLQRSLNEVEEQISASRRAYNATITSYNNSVEMFPTNLLAGMLNMQRKNVFEIPETQRENVDVGDLLNN